MPLRVKMLIFFQARREAWARERAQEIKEITIKGLEPEIQRLINKHRAEKRCLEEKLRRIPDDVRLPPRMVWFPLFFLL